MWIETDKNVAVNTDQIQRIELFHGGFIHFSGSPSVDGEGRDNSTVGFIQCRTDDEAKELYYSILAELKARLRTAK